MTDQDKVPPGFTEEEAWLVDNRVCEIKTSYKMTGCDTSQDYVTLTALSGKSVTWRIDTFSRLAKLASYVSSTSSLVEPKEYDLPGRVKARRAWDKANAREVSEYKRLKAKFEGLTPANPQK